MSEELGQPYQSQLLRRLIEMAERMARQAEMEASDE